MIKYNSSTLPLDTGITVCKCRKSLLCTLKLHKIDVCFKLKRHCIAEVKSLLVVNYQSTLPTVSRLLYLTCGIICCFSSVVITSRDLRRNGDIWVCPNADYVCTRFFFVYDDALQLSSIATFDTRKSQCKKEIDHAVEHIRNFKKSRKSNSSGTS